MQLTTEQIQAATGCGRDTAEGWRHFLEEALREFAIDTPARAAAFLSQVGHESGGLTHLEENMNYSAEGLARTWPNRFALDAKAPAKTPNAMAHALARNPQGLANVVYANRMGNGDPASGDGWRYRGRGLIGITGRENYRKCGQGLGTDLEAEPELLRAARWAARSAGWFWKTHNLNELADKRDVVAMTRRINGGTIGLPHRQALYEAALPLFA